MTNAWIVYPEWHTRPRGAYRVAYATPTGVTLSEPLATLEDAQKLLGQSISYDELENTYQEWLMDKTQQRFGQFLCNKMNWTNAKLFYANSIYLATDLSQYGVKVIF